MLRSDYEKFLTKHFKEKKSSKLQKNNRIGICHPRRPRDEWVSTEAVAVKAATIELGAGEGPAV